MFSPSLAIPNFNFEIALSFLACTLPPAAKFPNEVKSAMRFP